MSFTDVFGGSTVQPSEVRYRNIVLSNNVTLFWPQQGIDTDTVIARWNDVNAGAIFNITLPSATTVSTGQDAVFNNISASPFNILASDGSTIANVIPGQALYIILADNSTDAGSWQIVTFGAGSSQAQASSLAGAGLMAAAAVLNLNIPVQSIGTNYTTQSSDRATVINWTGGVGTLTATDPSTAGFGNGWLCEVANNGSGALTIDPAVGLIDGNATKVLNQTESVIMHTDGMNYYTVGYGRAVVSSFTRLVVNVAGNTDVTLTSSQAANQVIEMTGALTGNINVIVPATVAEFFTFNNTTGAHTLTFKTAAGTGIAITQGTRAILNCDGTNIVRADTVGSGTVTSITAGSGLSGGTITGSGTIALANTSVTPGAYTSANITVAADGRITAAASGGSGSVVSITAGAGLSGGTITTSGTISLPTTGVTPGTYTGPNITVDQYGRITAASGSAGFLPLGGGTITGNLTVNGSTTLHGTTTGSLVASQLQVISTGASLFLTTTSHHQWQVLSNSDNNLYFIDNSSSAQSLILLSTGGAQFQHNLTVNGNFNTNGITGTTIAGTTATLTGGIVTMTGVTSQILMTANGVREWRLLANNDGNFYLTDISGGVHAWYAQPGGNVVMPASLTVQGNFATNQINCGNLFGATLTCGVVNTQGNTIFAGPISCTTLNTNGQSLTTGVVSCSTLNTNNAGITCGAISSSTINTNNNSITCSTISMASGGGVAYAQQGSNFHAFSSSGTTLTFYRNGVAAGSFAFNAPSDERLKTNIAPAEGNALEELRQIRLISYDILSEIGDPNSERVHRKHGFSAQQLQGVVPEAVGNAEIGDGVSKTILTVDPLPLLARCVAAIQKLTERIEALEARVMLEEDR